VSEVPDDGDLTVKEFARQTRQHEQTVYRRCRSGEIPSYKLGKSLRIRREDAEALRQPRRLTPQQRNEIRANVDSWPPPTEDQRSAITALFTESERGDDDA